MKKSLVVTLLLLCGASSLAWGKEPLSEFRFRYSMHQMYKDYRSAYLGIQEKNMLVADIHLKRLLERLPHLPSVAPERGVGHAPDKERFRENLGKLERAATALRSALKKESAASLENLTRDLLGACVGCHSEAKLTYLFRQPGGRSLFAEYMHEISENIQIAEIYLQTGEGRTEAGDCIAIAGQYLRLLKNVLPEKGVSGVVMDKEGFLKEVTRTEGLTALVQEDIAAGKPADFQMVKKSLNTLCVACHEPDRIR